MSIGVETLKGVVPTVRLCQSATERDRAEALARHTPGAASVVNAIVIRP